jgi:hypothetical protein
MDRVLQPELLDTLSPTDPAAVHNRRDLRLTNILMRNHAWLQRTLLGLVRPGERVLELGAGDGACAIELNRSGVNVDGLDLWPRPDAWPADRDWHRRDLHGFTGWNAYAVVYGNLIFHQFPDATLRRLGEKLQSARVIIACEPARRRLSQWLYRTIGPLLGANHVSLHDAHVSIAAGFRDDELSAALGLGPDRWAVQHRITPIGAYHLVAVRLP